MNLWIVFVGVTMMLSYHIAAQNDQKSEEKHVYRRSDEVSPASYVLKMIPMAMKVWEHFKGLNRLVAIRIDNMTTKKLRNPIWYMKTGICESLPPYRVLNDETALMVFRKNPNDEKTNVRTSGLLAYEVVGPGNEVQTLLILWKAPQIHENQFLVWVTTQIVKQDQMKALYQSKTKTAVKVKSGEAQGLTKQCAYDPPFNGAPLYCKAMMGSDKISSVLQIVLTDTLDQTAALDKLKNLERNAG